MSALLRRERRWPTLLRNRDFQILWSGQVVSTLGSWGMAVALPLLVLDVTGSAAKTGIVSFAFGIPVFLFALPAGALLDRVDRKRAMIVCDAARLAASASVVGALWLDRVSLAQLILVGLVHGAGFIFFNVAQTAALKQVVPTDQLAGAMTQNEVRQHGAIVVGPALGGALYGFGASVPFFADSISYAVSMASLLLIRRPLQEPRQAMSLRLHRSISEGARWLWRKPFLRTTSLLVTGSDFVINAVYLVVIVVAREHGASAPLVGAMLMFLGLGGVVGAALAPLLARRMSVRQVVVATMMVPALLVPLLATTTNALVLGTLFGLMVLLHPTWAAVVHALRIGLTPDELLARAESIVTLLSLGPVPFARLAVGFLFAYGGRGATIAALSLLMAAVALAAALARSVREPPEFELRPEVRPAASV